MHVPVDIRASVGTYIHIYICLHIPYVKENEKIISSSATHLQPGRPIDQPWIWTKWPQLRENNRTDWTQQPIWKKEKPALLRLFQTVPISVCSLSLSVSLSLSLSPALYLSIYLILVLVIYKGFVMFTVPAVLNLLSTLIINWSITVKRCCPDHEFKSWTKLIAFHIALIPRYMGK